jgi:hypothetical protein
MIATMPRPHSGLTKNHDLSAPPQARGCGKINLLGCPESHESKKRQNQLEAAAMYDDATNTRVVLVEICMAGRV